MNSSYSNVVSRTVLLACALAAATWSLGLSSPATVAAQSEDAARMTNPVASTPASIAAGKALFDKQCVSCHGPTGKGDGKSAAQLNPKPSDLTDATWNHGSSDGEIFTLIKDGSKNTAMRGFASRMTPQEMWNVVNYLRTLSPSP
jgi:mono/diheme cytochrome c family protein